VVLLLCVAFLAIIILAGATLERGDFADFRIDAATESELIAHRLTSLDAAGQEALLNAYESRFNLRIGGVLEQLDSTWQQDEDNPSLYTNSIDDDPWETVWKIPGTTTFLWLIDNDLPINIFDLVEVFSPLALVFFVVGASLYWLSRKVARPISELARSSQALADGTLGSRVGGQFDEPFGSLAKSYDSMADRIERLIADQQILIGALPHELRGPVARLRFALDTTRYVDDLTEMRGRISTLDHYLNDLEEILEQTLLLVRFQHRDTAVQWGRFDLQRVAADVVEKTEQNKSLTVSSDFHVPVSIHGNESLIRLALSNLLSNAARYANSTIRIQATTDEENRVCLRVEDDGDGVSQEQRDSLFVPLSRIDESRSRDSGGLGLGLSLVELIARQHGGRVRYFSSALGGAGFAFYWPGLSKARERSNHSSDSGQED